MAVYKPTLCSPFLNGIDARIGSHTDTSKSQTKFLTCQIGTSNKNVTGYSVRLLDNNNNQIFPITSSSDEHDRISPITELQSTDFGYEEGGTNSGINGTTLRIPFFNSAYNSGDAGYHSYNAIYYSDAFLADHIIMASGIKPFTRDLTNMENIDNWTRTVSSGVEQLTYNWPGASEVEQRQNAIKLDSDLLQTDDIILVVGATADSRCGLWKVTSAVSQSGGSASAVTVLERYASVEVGQRITIIKGQDCHNMSWQCTGAATSSTQGTMTYMGSGGTWKDSQGSTISGFGCDDHTYKWEVVLYQGNHDGETSTAYGKYVTYENVKPEWLDMTLTSGKIMGTTPERVQIGGIFNDDFDNGIVPEGTDQDPLVLQGTYMELSSTAPSSILSGDTRVYVKTYDSTFGHAYPMTDTLNSTTATSANYCQFFEHSNNPDDILDTDIINYAFTNQVDITFYKVADDTWTSYGSEATWLANTSVLERYLVIYDSATSMPSHLQEGDLILLTGQTLPKQNGVYSVYTLYNGSTPKICIQRAASYDSWSDYLGKVIYATNGDTLRRTNFESLANAGAYTLWNPLDTTTGSSSLYFVKERPVLLFRNKLETDHTFDLFDTVNNFPGTSSSTTLSSIVDGVSMQVGDIVLYKDGSYGTVELITSSGYKLTTPSGSLATSDYFYILDGKNLGRLVFKWNASVTYTKDQANWDLHTGRVLHNTDTRTFISPWTGLEKNMQICLLNNEQVYYKRNDVYKDGSKWIKITGFNDKLYFITHQTLSSVKTTSSGDSPTPLQPYSASDESIPWRYDIKFFFRTSNENPFYAYETPYIKLSKNGSEYSGLSMVGGLSDFYVLATEAATAATEQFLVSNGDSFVVSMFTSQADITGRSVQLDAKYIQYGQSSWESYQWLLYNNQGELIQDTGKKYDKEIGVVFYGLANDSTESIAYTAVLLVTNDYGDTLEYSLVMTIVPGIQSAFLSDGDQFTATADCSTQSIEINFTGASSADTYSIYRREYEVYTRPGTIITGFYCPPGSAYPSAWQGKFYTTSACETEITPKGSQYLYRDQVSGYLYQYNSTYGTSSSEPAYEFTLAQTYKIYRGEWKPVLVKDTRTKFRDFNVQSHRSYQYVVYPGDSNIQLYGQDTVQQTFANYNGRIWKVSDSNSTQGEEIPGTYATSTQNGEAVHTAWPYWSVTELVPEELSIDAPIVRKKYKVDNDNIWIFKYSLDTGAQTQNFTKEEFQSLGQYSKYGFGAANADSGSVTALLGSELIPGSSTGYIERLRQSRVQPLSSNEKARMLSQWQDFCFSKNPKLLRDIKGRSWIVQIISDTNTPQNFVHNVPDTVSFQWKQVDSTDNVIIYGDYESDSEAIKESYGDLTWTPMYGSN